MGTIFIYFYGHFPCRKSVSFFRARRRFGGPGGPSGTPGARLPRGGGTLELLGALGALGALGDTDGGPWARAVLVI